MTYRARHVAPATGKRVARTLSDLNILEALHRFGPQTATALFELLRPQYKCYRSLLERIAQLRQVENNDYGGPLLFYPPQQRRGAMFPDHNHLVVDITPGAERLLQKANRWRAYHPTTNGQEWKHDFMVATIIASIAIGARGHCKFIHHDEIVSGLTLPFTVPPYTFKREDGKTETRNDARLRPDGFFALGYPNGVLRVFLVEADCHTEPLRSDNKRKSHKHNILQYHALIGEGVKRKELFGEARVGVLNIFTDDLYKQRVMELHQELLGNRGSYHLYRSWDAFNLDFFRPPPPRPELFHEPWARVGNEPFLISQ
jgi:hypothetical protein